MNSFDGDGNRYSGMHVTSARSAGEALQHERGVVQDLLERAQP